MYYCLFMLKNNNNFALILVCLAVYTNKKYLACVIQKTKGQLTERKNVVIGCT